MIVNPENMTFNDKKFSAIIYGSPGTGKTTVALSAPAPILIDFDRGISRVKAYHRKPTIFCNTYEEVLKDIESPEIKDFETFVIDTGGSFISYLQDWAMRDNPTVNKQKNGAISLKGFGAVKQEFQRFTNYVKDVLNKNIIYVFHSEEKTDKDGNPMQRLLCEGAAKNLVWQPCDFGGYMQMIGTKRVISFTPTDEFFAKGCFGIEGRRDIPTLGVNDKNDFITRLFDEAKANIEADNATLAPMLEQYEKVMMDAQCIIDSIETVEQANEALKILPTMEHALTSKKEVSAMLSEKTAELGFEFDKKAKAYKLKENGDE